MLRTLRGVRAGYRLGSEELANPSFTVDSTGWAAAGLATLTDIPPEVQVTVTGGGGGITNTGAGVPTVPLNTAYRFRALVRNVDYPASPANLAIVLDNITRFRIEPSTDAQWHESGLVSTSTTFNIQILRGSASTGTFVVDEMSVRRVF